MYRGCPSSVELSSYIYPSTLFYLHFIYLLCIEAALAELNYPSWLPVISILLLLFLGNGGYGTLIWVCLDIYIISFIIIKI